MYFGYNRKNIVDQITDRFVKKDGSYQKYSKSSF